MAIDKRLGGIEEARYIGKNMAIGIDTYKSELESTQRQLVTFIAENGELQRRIADLEALLSGIRAELARDPAIWAAELINRIDEVLPE